MRVCAQQRAMSPMWARARAEQIRDQTKKGEGSATDHGCRCAYLGGCRGDFAVGFAVATWTVAMAIRPRLSF